MLLFRPRRLANAASFLLIVGALLGRDILLAHPMTFVRVQIVTSLVSLLPASWAVLQMLGITSGGRGTVSVLQSEG